MKEISSHNEHIHKCLPCPWCGPEEFDKNGLWISYRSEKNMPFYYVVTCTCCGAETNNYDETLERAIERWNSRYYLASADDGKRLIKNAIQSLEKLIANQE